MRSLLGKLGGLLAQEYTLIRGVCGDIQYISDELASMQAFLGDLGFALDDHDRRLKNWMKQILDMAYDMEDCIDDFAHHLPQDSLSDARCSFIMMAVNEVWTFWPRRDIASKIAKLKVRAQYIAEMRSRYGVENPDPRGSSGAGVTHAVTYGIAEHLIASRQLIRTENPVRVEVDMDKLGGWLTKHDKGSHRAVVSLIGFGGVGKITIAMALYRDFRNEFDCRASVTVSQNFDEDEVLRNILGQIKPMDSPIKPKEEEHEGSNTAKLEKKSLVAGIKSSVKRVVPLLSGHRPQSNDGSTKSKIETMNRDQLIEELKKRMLGRRYLLLIHNIWSVETWETIRNWLPHDNTKHSRVIVTTRFQAVGAACSERDGTDYLHTVNVLSDADSKSLFHQGVPESPSSKEGERMDTRSQAVGTESSEGDGTEHLHSADLPSDANAKGPFDDRVSDPQSSKEKEKRRGP